MLESALLAAALAAGDPRAGEAVYSRCLACHSLTHHRTGPKHCGLFGRRAGTSRGFEDYSSALRGSGITWNEKTLDRFLADPTKVVPSTTMTYAGVKDARERADLIAYLKKEGKCPGS